VVLGPSAAASVACAMGAAGDVGCAAGRSAVLGSLQRVGHHLQRVPTETRGSLRTIPLPTTRVEALRAHRVRQNTDRLAVGARWIVTDLVSPPGAAPQSSRAP
jgi:hypothetical protein